MPNSKDSDARPIFRWLAGLSAPVFVLTAIVTAFPQLLGGNAEPSWPLASLLLWGGALFGTIATTGKLKS